MDSAKVIYWISTGLMCALFAFSAGMYFTQYEMVQGFFEHLGFPVWIIYPLAVAKVLGIVAVLSNKSQLLKEWAYAGFFFDAILAAAAHQITDGGGAGMSIGGIILVLVSRYYDSKIGR